MSSWPRVSGHQRTVFFTGAGLSAASGVPTYRGAGGLWKHYDYQQYACQRAFDRDPVKVWDFHNYRRTLVGACAPSLGHRLMAEAEARWGDRVTVVTQNIDGLHQRAGSQRVHELHGSLWRVRCDECGARATRLEAPLEELSCPDCGSWWRPDITWFEDPLDASVVESALAAIESCDLLIAVGTSAVVYPAAEMPLLARRRGATLVEVNLEDTPLSSSYTHRIRLPADQALAELCREA